jgi:hypothetical protein
LVLGHTTALNATTKFRKETIAGWALAGFVAVLLTSRRGDAVGWSIALASSPLILLAISALRMRVLTVALVVVVQISAVRILLFDFHFLPEHFILVLLLGALVVRAPHAMWRRPAAFEMLFLAWVGWNALVTMLRADDTSKSLAIVGWMMLAWLIMWALRSAFLFSPEDFQPTMRAGLIVAAALGIFAFTTWLMALLGGPQIRVQPEFVTNTLGAQGLANEGNIFASGELFWLFWLIRDRVLHGDPLPTWQVAAVGLGIVSSMTRAAWLAGVFVVVASVYVARRPTAGLSARQYVGRGRGKLVACVAVLILAVGFATPAGEKFNESLNFKQSTGAGRLTNWKLAWRDIGKLDGYLTGLGTNTYGQRHLSRTNIGQPDYLGNLPLTVFYDTGIVGLAFFLGGFGAMIFRSRDPSTRIMSAIFVVALLVVGAATSPIWFGFVWVMVAAIDTDSGRSPPAFTDDRGLAARPATPRAPVLGR